MLATITRAIFDPGTTHDERIETLTAMRGIDLALISKRDIDIAETMIRRACFSAVLRMLALNAIGRA